MPLFLRITLILFFYSEQGTPTLLLENPNQAAKLAISQIYFLVKPVIPKAIQKQLI
jgi:hypothetical protein